MVRDVPDMRGSWYQRSQQQSAQSSYSQQSVSSMDGAPMPQPPAGSSQQPEKTTAASGSGKPSLAAMFAKHPAITEEPTTPGGTLAPGDSATPTPTGGRRSPFARLQPGTSGTLATSGRALSPAGASSEQVSQIISLLNELKRDLKQDMGELSKRVDQMDSNLNRVTQTVGRLDKQYQRSGEPSGKPPSSLQVVEFVQQPAHSRRSSRGSTSGASEAAGSTKSTATLKPPEVDQSIPEPPEVDGGKPKRRERSKSPHRGHHSHHHSHHHHHRKATHPTPTSTPTASQAELARPPEPSTSGRAKQQEPPSSLPLVPKSFEQSDDDQDATSKL